MSKASLRDFQDNLARKLANTSEHTSARALLGVQSGTQHWLIDLTELGEISPVPMLTPVPLTCSWLRGLANVRGMLYTVCDYSAFQGGGPTGTAGEARLLLPHGKFHINSALLVSRVLGLRSIDDFEPAEAAEDTRPWVSEILVDTQQRLWHRLDPHRLYSDERFLSVGQ
jgi:twitching motility protein PilI